MQETTLINALHKVFPHIDRGFQAEFFSMLSWPEDALLKASNIRLEKPYGSNNIIRESGDWGLSYVCFEPGRRTSIHYHNTRQEFFYVRSGVLTLWSDNLELEINAGQTGYSTPGKQHSLMNNSPTERMTLLEIFSPALLNDKVRVTDFYERPVGSVEYYQ